MPAIAALVALLRLATEDRIHLALENIALRHQIAVYTRSAGRPNITGRDRIIWLTVMRMLREWRDALVIVQPATVIKWHRNRFRPRTSFLARPASTAVSTNTRRHSTR